MLFYALQLKHSARQRLDEDTRLSRLFHHITVTSLACRRYEKDYFLNILNEERRSSYLLKWKLEWAALEESIDSVCKQPAFGQQSFAPTVWKNSIQRYRAQFHKVVEQAKKGAITHPTKANEAIAVAKDGMRQIINESENCKTEIDQLIDDNRTALAKANIFAVLIVLSGVFFVSATAAWLFWAARQAVSHSLRLAEYSQRIKIAKKDAESSSVAKSEFLANMSHEIRTPMTAILGFTDVLLGNLKKSEDIDTANTIKRNGKYLLALINDILDLAKVESGKIEIEQVDYSPIQMIADAASLLRVRATAKGLPLEVRFDGPIPETICTDPTRLRQIVINIVGNAIKFTETGSVQIVTRLIGETSGDPKLQIDVIDTGIGIAENKIEKIFQPFTQSDSSTTRLFGGTGLGLSISKRMAELLGCYITVTSSVGNGSTFSIAIATGPLDNVRLIQDAEEAVVERVTASKADNTELQLQSRRILLAEDGPDNQRLISFILKKAGAKVTLADNGQIGFDLATESKSKGRPFDVILMDMQMPVLDGYSATRKLRESDYHGPIIALTAHALSSDRQKCLDAGCDDYATKPIDRMLLISMVAKYVSGQELLNSSESFVA